MKERFQKCEYSDCPDEVHFFSGGAVSMVFRPTNPNPERQAYIKDKVNNVMQTIHEKYAKKGVEA